MKLRAFALISLLSTVIPSLARAGDGDSGGWVSSGGEKIKDANNPWWVKNTRTVSYCIKLDSSSVSVDLGTAQAVVHKALDYWLTQFKETLSVPGILPNGSELGVGTQTFVERQLCKGDEDLVLQFGYKTLSSTQRKYLVTPTHFVGVAVRTEYDPVKLHGKGFILIGSDKGAERFNPPTSDYQSAPWSSPALLYLVVLHELGHVFGIPHFGNSSVSIMAEDYPEIITLKTTARFLSSEVLAEIPDLRNFFSPYGNYFDCALSAAGRSFFKLSPFAKCLRITFADRSSEISFYELGRIPSPYFYKPDPTDRFVGKVKIDPAIMQRLTGQFIPGLTHITALLGNVRLNPKQAVFPKIPGWPSPITTGAFLWGVNVRGLYEGANSLMASGVLRLKLGGYHFEVYSASGDQFVRLAGSIL